MSSQREIQENEYQFPYHYLPRFDQGNYIQSTALNWGFVYFSYLNFVVDKIKSLSLDTHLDVGCGDGRLLYELGQHDKTNQVIGVDNSIKAIRLAKSMNPAGNYVCGDITDQSLFPNPFNLVTLIETLEHIPLDFMPQFMEGVRYYLKPHGLLLVTVPSVNVPVHKKHFQHFTLESLMETIGSDFELMEHFYLNRTTTLTYYLPAILSNKLYTINSPQIMNFAFDMYQKRYFHADANDGARICVICRKKP